MSVVENRLSDFGRTRKPVYGNSRIFFRALLLACLIFCRLLSPVMAEEEKVIFAIDGFAVAGNTLLPEAEIAVVLEPLAGPRKSAEDVETARTVLEKFYRDQGYPTVMVNIPEQDVESGTIRLEVVEGRVRNLIITGNRYFTMEKITRDLPSFAPGEIVYLPRARKELARINRNPDFKVAPVMSPGKYPGTVDVEMKVKDRLPLHGNLEVNNRATHDTSDLRLNAGLHYDNLWQKEHSISFQYQTSPLEPAEVQALSGSYLLRAPWNDNNMLALFGVWSDSDTAFGDGFEVIGKGFLMGARYVVPLPEADRFSHHVTLGLDYKDFEEKTGLSGAPEDSGDTVPITYMPLSVAYGAQLPDAGGLTKFEAGLNLCFRGAVTDQREFEDKRYKAKGNYLAFRLGMERTQQLFAGLKGWLRMDGQLANQPLVNNEQYIAGGMTSVRGYKESEAVGDDAFHTMLELRGPDLMRLVKGDKRFKIRPFCFYDYAALRIQDPLPLENQPEALQGAGCGVRGYITNHFAYEVDWALALADTDKVAAGDSRAYFQGKFEF
ncbi:MAG: ShlB/FhaC/HecB family hemolysin secretion/activation protein [Thermodesulfobacteriota bacterium]